MEIVIIIAVVAAGLLLVELLLPTGGVLAVIGAAAFVAAGIVALGEDDISDYVGPGLITLGVLSLVTFFIVTPKILKAHRDEPVRTGWEELVGHEAEVRESLDPVGQVWVEGALWKARVHDGAAALRPGNRVVIEKVDGLTLLVRPVESMQSEVKE